MKLHTTLTARQVMEAMDAVKQRGLVTGDIQFIQFDPENSRTHPHGYKIQLGTFDKTSGPTRSRHYKNSGQYGADTTVWAASYTEWGWFLAEIFDQDPDAKFGDYKDYTDFHAKTENRYGAGTPIPNSDARTTPQPKPEPLHDDGEWHVMHTPPDPAYLHDYRYRNTTERTHTS